MTHMSPHEESAQLRPVIVSVDGRDPVRVELEHRGRRHVGQCATAPGRGPAEAAAIAALDALDRLTPSAAGFHLDWCGVVDPGGGVPAAILVFATVSVAGVPMQQTGSALLRDDVRMAAVRAALDAMNRRLQVLGL